MKRQFLIFSIIFIVTLSLAFGFLKLRTEEIIPGAASTKLPGRCEIVQFGPALQPVHTVVLSCPNVDMIRLWPLPVQQPWFEDWREKLDGILAGYLSMTNVYCLEGRVTVKS